MTADNSFNKDLLNVLACPKDKARLDYNQQNNELVCSLCKTKYVIKDGIPMMLSENIQ